MNKVVKEEKPLKAIEGAVATGADTVDVVAVTKEAEKPAKKSLSPETAMQIVKKTFADVLKYGVAKALSVDPYLEALKLAELVAEDGRVAVIFGVQVSYLWAALEAWEKKASENLARIAKDKNAKAFYENRKNAWIGDAVIAAQLLLKKDHNTLLPVPGETFVPQSMDREFRLKVEKAISKLQEVAGFAICEKDGRKIGIDRLGNPFPQCFTCSQASKPKPVVAVRPAREYKERGYEIPSGASVDAHTLEEAARAEGVTLELKGRKAVVAEVVEDDADLEVKASRKKHRASKKELAAAEDE